ncbi:MAG: hypothetical protein ACREOO_22245 [bacterium]
MNFPRALLERLNKKSRVAVFTGAYLVEINPEETSLTPLAQLFIAQAAGEALPGLIQALQKVS